MRRSSLASPGVLGSVTAVVLLAAVQMADQAPAKAAAAARAAVPRTAWGAPDLQGIWEGRSNTPLERPNELAGKEFLTEQEAAKLDRQTAETDNLDRREGKIGTTTDVYFGYNQFWREKASSRVRRRRTSLIVDPPEGKIPPLTPAAQKQESARAERRRLHPADGPEDRGLFERCLLGLGGLPRLVGGSNSNVQIFQTPDHVVLFHEMIHESRIIPLDGRPHVSQNIRQWLGDSRGHWEGDTLVVDTTNFVDMMHYRRSSERMHLIERFTRVDADTLNYEVTIDDPATFTRPWTAVLPMPRAEGTIFEYACHEGNYSLPNQLSAARAEDKARAEAAKKASH
jgi:hypothetical protein